MTSSPSGDCSWVGCSRVASTLVEKRSLCLEHFFEIAQRRIASVEAALGRHAGERALDLATQGLLSELIFQMSLLATATRTLSPSSRERLLTLSNSATALYRRLHRPPRFLRRIACLLRTGVVSPEIAEKCFTVNISQSGACIETRQQFRLNQTVSIEICESPGRSAVACVAWSSEISPGVFRVGLQISSPVDFWGISVSSNPARQRRTLTTR